MRHVLEREQLVPRPLTEVFAFFADASNLERITPRALRFKILTPLPIAMSAGTLIDYRIALFGVGFHWQTLIEVFEPDVRFVDVQLKGPYRYWRHVHEFTAQPDGVGCMVRDRVEYELPFGPLGALARRLMVARQLDRIFDYRREVIAARFDKGQRRAT